MGSRSHVFLTSLVRRMKSFTRVIARRLPQELLWSTLPVRLYRHCVRRARSCIFPSISNHTRPNEWSITYVDYRSESRRTKLVSTLSQPLSLIATIKGLQSSGRSRRHPNLAIQTTTTRSSRESQTPTPLDSARKSSRWPFQTSPVSARRGVFGRAENSADRLRYRCCFYRSAQRRCWWRLCP